MLKSIISLSLILSSCFGASSALAASGLLLPLYPMDSPHSLRVQITSPTHDLTITEHYITLSGTYTDDIYPKGVIPADQDGDHSLHITKNSQSSPAFGPIDEPCCATPERPSPGHWTVVVPISAGINTFTVIQEVTDSYGQATDSIQITRVVPGSSATSLTNDTSTESGGHNGGGDSDDQPTIHTVTKTSNVPATVEKVFQSVFGEKITSTQSNYWKHRLRTDKNTEAKLKNAMLFYKLQGKTIPARTSNGRN